MVEKLSVTILGCGSSGGVPRIDGDWGDCDPSEIKNLRSRCSLLVQKFNTKTPVLALTANTSKEDIERYVSLGFSNVISKPFTSDEFLNKISLVI